MKRLTPAQKAARDENATRSELEREADIFVETLIEERGEHFAALVQKALEDAL